MADIYIYMSAIIFLCYVIRISEGVLFVLAVSINVYQKKLSFFPEQFWLVWLILTYFVIVSVLEKKRKKKESVKCSKVVDSFGPLFQGR